MSIAETLNIALLLQAGTGSNKNRGKTHISTEIKKDQPKPTDYKLATPGLAGITTGSSCFVPSFLPSSHAPKSLLSLSVLSLPCQLIYLLEVKSNPSLAGRLYSIRGVCTVWINDVLGMEFSWTCSLSSVTVLIITCQLTTDLAYIQYIHVLSFSFKCYSQ